VQTNKNIPDSYASHPFATCRTAPAGAANCAADHNSLAQEQTTAPPATAQSITMFFLFNSDTSLFLSTGESVFLLSFYLDHEHCMLMMTQAKIGPDSLFFSCFKLWNGGCFRHGV
jgi:hypothetical protein